MPYVVKSDRQYTNGKTAVLYHKKFGLFCHECTNRAETAFQYRTKRDAEKTSKTLGNGWYVEKI